jgi:uncharacterized membrane-anchored protein
MSNNDQASEDEGMTDNDEVSGDGRSPGNPFAVDAQDAEREMPTQKEEPQVEDDEISGNTNDSINSSLDEVKDVGVLKSMVTRLRHENGNHRKRNKELQLERDTLVVERAKRAEAVKEAEEKAAAAEAKARSYMVKFAAEEYNVDEDLLDILERGSTEEEVFSLAAKIRDTKKRKPAYETAETFDPFAKRSGKPVRPQNQGKDPGGEFMRDLLS